MIFLESDFSPTITYRPIISLDLNSPEAIAAIPTHTPGEINVIISKDFLHARGKQKLLNELRNILLKEFFICTNPFDTVALTNRAIDILDRYEGKLANDIQRFDILGPSFPNVIIPDSEFNKFISRFIK